MKISDGQLQDAATAVPVIERLLSRCSTLDADDLALILSIPTHHTEFQNWLVFENDLRIDADLVLDRHQRWVTSNKLAAIACLGNLTIQGNLLCRDDQYWPLLFMGGSLSADNIVKGGLPLIVLGDLKAAGSYVPAFNDGPMRIGGDLVAEGYIPGCRDNRHVRGHVIGKNVRARHIFDARVDHGRTQLRKAFVPDVLTDGYPDADKILSAHAQGQSIFRASAIGNDPVPPPLQPPALSPVDPVRAGWLQPARGRKALLVQTIHEVLRTDPERAAYVREFDEFVRYQFEAAGGDAQVLVLPPGATLEGDLELDWKASWVKRERIIAILAEGDLTVEGDVLNWTLEGGPMLFVKGDLRTGNLLKGGAPVIILCNIVSRGLVVGEYNDGVLRVGGQVQADAFLLLDHSSYVLQGVKARMHSDDDTRWREVLVPAVFDSEHDDSPSACLIWAMQRSGGSIFQESSDPP